MPNPGYSEIDKKIKSILSSYEDVLNLLCEIPGTGKKTAEDLVAEIGLDMSIFPSGRHLCSWVGISSGNSESAGKKKRSHNARK